MPRRAQAGAYAPRRIALCVPFRMSRREAEDLAYGVEILTDRVVDLRPCRSTAAYAFPHFALWIYGTVSKKRMDRVQNLLTSLRASLRTRAPAHR